MKTLHLFVEGIVQGVGFRFFVYRIAQQLGICGWVRNLPDGRVEILAQGKSTHLQEFLKELRIGPRFAKVTNIEVQEEPDAPILNSFEITY
ncbi:MAG: acylphosphatase [Calditrichaeota bacterium]|nr:MAG: acylphosphatase [Calditrichota bacterium]